MKVKDIRKRNKRQVIYAYSYQVGNEPRVSRRIATRDVKKVGAVHFSPPPPAGALLRIDYGFCGRQLGTPWPRVHGANGFTVAELLGILAILAICAVLIIPTCVSRENTTVLINTNEWVCTQSSPRQYQYQQLIGRLPVTKTGTRMECVSWNKP